MPCPAVCRERVADKPNVQPSPRTVARSPQLVPAKPDAMAMSSIWRMKS